MARSDFVATSSPPRAPVTVNLAAARWLPVTTVSETRADLWQPAGAAVVVGLQLQSLTEQGPDVRVTCSIPGDIIEQFVIYSFIGREALF